MRKSVLLQFRRAKESASTGLAQFEVKLHKVADPVLIFGVLMRGAQHRKVELAKELQEILDLHNVFKCMHVVPLLDWDVSIASTSQSWAGNGVYKHSLSDSRKQGSEICDKYLAWLIPRVLDLIPRRLATTTLTTDGVLDLADIIYSDSGETLEQFTQVVWKSSTRLG